MKLLILSVLLLSSVALPVSAACEFDVVSSRKLGGGCEQYQDTGAEEGFAKSESRFADQDLERNIGETEEGKLSLEAVERALKRPPKGKKGKGKISVELLLFRDPVRGPSYKYYVLAGQIIRHYRVIFETSQTFRFRRETQRRTIRCIIRQYNKKCARLPRFVRGCCITFVARKCSGKFTRFEIADPETQGKDEVNPPNSDVSEPGPAESPAASLTITDVIADREVPVEYVNEEFVV